MLLKSPSPPLPSNPLLAPSSPSPPPAPLQDAELFTDVFSASSSPPLETNSSEPESSTNIPSAVAEPSDIPRLRANHVTAGYREGIAAAKTLSLQGGFDEGYSLGTVMGLRIGQILGLLEGLSKALDVALEGSRESEQRQNAGERLNAGRLNGEASRCSALVVRAREDLNVGKVFGKEYWNEDGTWSYEVEDGIKEYGPIFEDVVSSHPLIREWETEVRFLMKRFGIEREKWEGEEWEKGRAADRDVG